jgi:spore coat protein U-like protein
VLRLLIAALLLLLSASFAHAANCTVHVGDLDFGQVDAIGNTTASTMANVDISCDSITPSTTSITLCGNIGAGSGGVDSGLRQSLSADGALSFVLTGPDGLVPWGSTGEPTLGSPLRIDLPVSGTTAALTTQLRGEVPAGQSGTPVGEYSSNFNAANSVFTYAEGELDCAAPIGGTDATAPFTVNASVVANCLLATADLDFGTAGIIGSNIDAQTQLDITCTPGTGYSIGIDGGGSHDPDNRLLRSGANTVSYGLYSDPSRTAPWGTDTGKTVDYTGTGAEQQLGVYGRIPPQPAAPGAYTDTVVVTITYN